MDLKNLSGAASGLGDKLPGMGGHGADGMMGKLFPDTGRKTSEEEFGKMQECAKMLEKYVARVPKESGCINMDSPDAERWKNDFFKNLVHGGPELLDDQFYTGDKTAKSNMGIGTDCSFSCEELFQFLFVYMRIFLGNSTLQGEGQKRIHFRYLPKSQCIHSNPKRNILMCISLMDEIRMICISNGYFTENIR